MLLESYYLDACSSTPLHPKVIEKINLVNTKFYGNPSSIHIHGIESAKILESARLEIASSLNASYEDIIFTSGSTESINLAIKGVCSTLKPGRIVVSEVEHSAVNNAVESLVKTDWSIEKWPVDQSGNLRIEFIDKLLSPPTRIVSLIYAQSEIGTIQPIELIAEECKSRDIIFHTDATQLIPHSLIDFKRSSIDLLTASAHKFQGPKGIGFLLSKKNVRSKLKPILLGGPQEFGYRAGTEPVALIAGMNIALGLIKDNSDFKNNPVIFNKSNVSQITKKLLDLLSEIRGLKYIGNEFNRNRIPNHISLLVSDKCGNPISSRSLVRKLSNKGISVSSGSACNSSALDTNQTLKAMKYEEKWLASFLRISTGSWIDINSVDRIAEIFRQVLSEE